MRRVPRRNACRRASCPRTSPTWSSSSPPTPPPNARRRISPWTVAGYEVGRTRAGERSHRRGIAFPELSLVPIGIGKRAIAGRVQLCHLLRRQSPADGAEILLQLLLVPRADDHRRDGRPLQQPVERDLRDQLAGLPGDLVERIDDAEEMLVFYWRAPGG